MIRPRSSVWCASFLLTLSCSVPAARFESLSVVDQGLLRVHFLDGEVVHRDTGEPPCAFVTTNCHDDEASTIVRFGRPLDRNVAGEPTRWRITSADDPAYGPDGRSPVEVFRRSSLNGMAEEEWVERDFRYEYSREHFLYLELPAPLQQGATYTIAIPDGSHSDVTEHVLTFDFATSQSEAIHVALTGYPAANIDRPADLYYWLGDGGVRDFSRFEGSPVLLIEVDSGRTMAISKVRRNRGSNPDVGGYQLVPTPAWTLDFGGNLEPGEYRLAVEGIGCSPPFRISREVWQLPFDVSLLGFYYMRIGEVANARIPAPRQPRYIPGEDPESTTVILTSMDPFHPDWNNFASGGDPWDFPLDWVQHAKPGNPTNPRAIGGHADALDWDRHLGHVSIIYDLLLPFLLLDGEPDSDESGIPESGNGIPDLLDEARNEVDFWLSLRTQNGYGHGLTNPTKDHVFYQADETALAAWANAANCAMLADAFRVAGLSDLAGVYLRHAREAFSFACGLDDPMLDIAQDVGGSHLRGRDFKMLAAAHLFNLTGRRAFESIVRAESVVDGPDSPIHRPEAFDQTWATAAYLITPHDVTDPAWKDKLRTAITNRARSQEAGMIAERPSRRATDEATGYFHTVQNVQRTLIAHAVATDPDLRRELLDALILEATWSLGRNPLNIIQMTTDSTPLARFRSIGDIYTSGRNDGTPGLHPGHTPYLNIDDWAPAMIMGRPSWMSDKSHPPVDQWPRGLVYFPSRYVWSHGEFTPQQTMRGKTALYAYLHGLSERGH